MPVLQAPANPCDRARIFMLAYMKAKRGTDVQIHAGRSEDGERALVIKLGKKLHGFTLMEAGVLAEVFEDGLREFGTGPHTEGFGQIVAAIRESVNRLNAH
jgi:hypothetical protein